MANRETKIAALLRKVENDPHINAETHSKLRYEAAERWVPEAYKRMTDSVALRELAPKFDKAAASVRNSFYNPSVAAKASTRVQI